MKSLDKFMDALKENNKVTIYLQANTKLVVSMLYSNNNIYYI